MNRRAWLMVGAGATALAAGAFVSWRMSRPSDAPAGLDSPDPSLWTLRFEQPAGGELAMAGLRGKPLVLNFWATWCPPCVKEMPQLSRFAREYGPTGWQVVGLAADRPEPVRRFLTSRPVDFPVGLASKEAFPLSESLGNAQGGLPFTVVLNAAGRIAHRRLGETSFEELAKIAQTLRGAS